MCTGPYRLRVWLHELDSVAEGIGHVHPVIALERLVVFHGEPGLGTGLSKRADVVDDEGRVRLRCRPKVVVDSEVNLQVAVFEPAAATGCEVRWFGHV